MLNKPTDDDLKTLPSIHDVSSLPAKEMTIYLRFTIWASEWLIAAYEPASRVYFGFVLLNNDVVNSEWGDISRDELEDINIQGTEIIRDMSWTPKLAKDVPLIRECGGV